MEYIIHVAIIAMIYSSLAISLNLLVGYTGMLSMTHAAFYGIGAYATAILTTIYDFAFLPTVGAGIGVSLILAVIVGLVLSNIKGDYYALGSFGFTVVVYSILQNWTSLTKGSLGIFGIPRPEFFGYTLDSSLSMLALAISVCVLCVSTAFFMTRGHFGRVLRAIRDNQSVLPVFGYDIAKFKLIIFCVAAVMASICGAIFAAYVSFINPSSFTLVESIFILTIVIFGGAGSIAGSIVGAIFLVALPEALRFIGFPSDVASQMRIIIYGAILIYLVYIRPRGLLGTHAI